ESRPGCVRTAFARESRAASPSARRRRPPPGRAADRPRARCGGARSGRDSRGERRARSAAPIPRRVRRPPTSARASLERLHRPRARAAPTTSRSARARHAPSRAARAAAPSRGAAGPAPRRGPSFRANPCAARARRAAPSPGGGASRSLRDRSGTPATPRRTAAKSCRGVGALPAPDVVLAAPSPEEVREGLQLERQAHVPLHREPLTEEELLPADLPGDQVEKVAGREPQGAGCWTVALLHSDRIAQVHDEAPAAFSLEIEAVHASDAGGLRGASSEAFADFRHLLASRSHGDYLPRTAHPVARDASGSARKSLVGRP